MKFLQHDKCKYVIFCFLFIIVHTNSDNSVKFVKYFHMLVKDHDGDAQYSFCFTHTPYTLLLIEFEAAVCLWYLNLTGI